MTIPIILVIITVLVLALCSISFVTQRASIILLRHRLRSSMRECVEINNFLSLYTQNMKSTAEIANWMNVTSRYVAELVEAQSVCIFVREGDTLRPVGVSGPFPMFQKAASQYVMTKQKYLMDQLKNERVYMGCGLIGEVAQSRQGVVWNGEQVDRSKLYTTDPLAPIDCIMALPLTSEGEVTGVICAINTAVDSGLYYTSEQFARFRFISGQVELASRMMSAYLQMSEQQRLNQELEFARSLQRSLLPETVPQWGQFSLHAFTRSSKEVSGDFYDFIQIDDDRLLVVIGDACGKGVPACMITAMTRSFIRANIDRYTSLMDLMLELNDNLYRDSGPGQYITLGCCVLNRKTSTIEYVRGGHTELMVYIHEHIRSIYPDGAGIGLLPSEDVSFDTLSIEFSPGMSMLLFTDGINEAVSPKTNEEFGVTRLKRIYKNACITKVDPDDFINETIHTVDEFAQTPGGEGQQDDQTIVLIHYV